MNPAVFPALVRLGYLPEGDYSTLTNFDTSEVEGFLSTVTETFAALNADQDNPPDATVLRPLVEGAELLSTELKTRGDADQLAASLAARLDAVNARPTRTPVGALAAAVGPVRRPVARRPASSVTAAFVTSGGKPLSTEAELAEVVARSFGRLGKGQSQVVAGATWRLPLERQLTEDASLSTARMNAVTSEEALVASGGVCQPVGVDFSVPTWGSTARPVRDALPRFDASRGGLRYVAPPTLTSAADAVALWSAANDADPTSPATKPVLTFACSDEVLVLVDAIPARVRIGNFSGRYSPEQVAALLAQVETWQARFAEINLLNKINAASTEVTTAKLLGATEDMLAMIDQAASAYRYRQRIDPTTSLRAVLPSFAREMFRADMSRRLATENSVGQSAFAVSDAQIQSWFDVRHVNVTWTVDGIAAQGSGNTYPLQGWAAQSTGALLDWPAQIVWNLFAEGTFVFLDGGRLELGVVRDNASNDVNQYQVFSELFESCALRGLEALKLVSTVRPSGATAGTVSTTSY